MITIRPIAQQEVPVARRVILTIAHKIYGWKRDLEEMIHIFETNGEFADMDHIEEYYRRNNGIFLVVLDDDTIIGSGAIRRFDAETAELKRLWLLEDYHGKGIGYQVTSQLFEFSRRRGYKRIILQTSPEQVRAIGFYKRLGFHEIDCYNGKTTEISMEMFITT